MPEPINPYAAPTSDLHPAAALWLGEMPPSLARVYRGLTVEYYGILILLLNMIGLATIGTMGILQFERVLEIYGWVNIVAAVLLFVGPILCLATPPESGAEGFIYAAVGSMIVSTLIGVAASFIDGLPRELEYAGHAIGFLSLTLFVLFMRKLAQFIGDFRSAARARNVLIAGAVLLLAAGVYLYYALRDADQLRWFFGIAVFNWFSLALVVGGITVFVMFANLVDYLRKSIRTGMVAG